MARALVGFAAARDKRLPAVSVKSGRPADGYAPVPVEHRLIHLPLTQDEFDRLLDLRNRQAWAKRGGVGCLLLGAALSRFPVVLPLAVVIAVLSLVLWVLIALALRAFLPSAEIEGDRIRLGRVHSGFVAALDRGDS